MHRMPLTLGALLLATATPLMAWQQETRLVPAGPELPEAYSNVSGLRVLPGGRLLVSDGIEETVQVVDARTGAATQVSRNGAGPGEYGQPDALLPMPDNGTLLVDLGNARFTHIGPDGKVGTSNSMVTETATGYRVLMPAGADARGNLYALPPSRDQRDSTDVIRFRAGQAGETPVAKVGLPVQAQSTSGGANNQRQIGMPQPYSARDAWAVAPDGRLAIARATPYRLDWVAASGQTITGPAVAWTPTRVTARERDAFAEQMGRGIMMQETNNNGQRSMSLRRGSGGGAPMIPLDQLEWPETMPAFPPGAVRVAPDGTAWVERYVPAGSAPRTDVFDGAGRRVRQLVLPAATRVAGFGDGVVWLVRTDDDGLQWLRPYKMPG